jgi:hypothetical protein
VKSTGRSALSPATLWVFCIAAVLSACHRAPTPRDPLVAASVSGATAPLPHAGKWEKYAMAQAASWLDPRHLAVGRWDGAMTVFAVPEPQAESLALVGIAATPARQPIEMIVPISATRLVTSNDDGSLADWRFAATTGLRLAGTAVHDRRYGTANSAVVVARGERTWLATGHANGWVLVWDVAPRPPRLVRAVDVRSPDPVKRPGGEMLRNVRGLVVSADDFVVAGAEDGDLSVMTIPEARVVNRVRFNPAAQLGINALALVDDLLLVGNCAKGTSDRNLWLFRLDGTTLTRLDSTNLVHDGTRPQVYTFDVESEAAGGERRFYASTEEGLVWGGRIEANALRVLWRQPVDAGLGAALALRAHRLGAVSYNLRVFALQ